MTKKINLHVITSEKFFAALTNEEYALYAALKVISYHNNGGQHYLYENQINFEKLAEKLELRGRTAGSTIKRTNISKLFKSLVSKRVLVKKKVNIDGNDTFVYNIIKERENGYKKFTEIDKDLLSILTKVFKGNVIKTYLYLKATFEYNALNGSSTTLINRNTIALAIGEVNKQGKINRSQLDNITDYMIVLYNLGLINVVNRRTLQPAGNYTECYEILKINNQLKKIPKAD